MLTAISNIVMPSSGSFGKPDLSSRKRQECNTLLMNFGVDILMISLLHFSQGQSGINLAVRLKMVLFEL